MVVENSSENRIKNTYEKVDCDYDTFETQTIKIKRLIEEPWLKRALRAVPRREYEYWLDVCCGKGWPPV